MNMACIGCGLAVNTDGKGRVDVDTVGGLTCAGTGGGTTNTSSSGLSIKRDTVRNGNSVDLGSNGLFVPAAFRLETFHDDTFGTALTGPANGTSVNSADATISISNPSSVTKVYCYSASVGWGSDNPNPGIHMELVVNEGGGGFSVNTVILLPIGTIISPTIGPVRFVALGPGQSTTLTARMQLYTGYISQYRTNIDAWGGYTFIDT